MTHGIDKDSVQCSAGQCSAVQCCEVQCSAVQCSAVLCSAVQFSAVQCSAVQCSAVQCTQTLFMSSYVYKFILLAFELDRTKIYVSNKLNVNCYLLF